MFLFIWMNVLLSKIWGVSGFFVMQYRVLLLCVCDMVILVLEGWGFCLGCQFLFLFIWDSILFLLWVCMISGMIRVSVVRFSRVVVMGDLIRIVQLF